MGNKSRFSYTIQAFHEGVTGSCILVCVNFPDGNITRFLVDCGNFQGKEQYELNFKFGFTPDKIDFVLVTHNHTDHTARLPMLVKKGFEGPIYTSHMNKTLMPPALYDSAKVLKSIAKLRNEKALYTEGDVKDTFAHITSVNYNKPCTITDNITATFLKNGHLLGASMIFLEFSFPGYESIYLLFTGDYSPSNTFFDVPDIPDWIRKMPLTVIIESTYGDRDTSEIEKVFNNNIIYATKNRQTVMCPAFSQGRAQEILYKLKCMQDTGELDKNIPIHIDGNLLIKYTEKYKKCEDISSLMKDFVPVNSSYVTDESRDDLLRDPEQKIIVSSSGMGTYGPSQIYIPELISRKNVLIHFTGYLVEGSLGRDLMDAKEKSTIIIGGRARKKLAEVKTTAEFSAHAKGDELIKFLQQFTDLKMVLINHGEPKTKEVFASRVLEEVSTKNVGILGGNYAFRNDRYGYVKSLYCN